MDSDNNISGNETMARNITSGMVFELVLGVLVLGILLIAQFLHAQKAAKAGPTPTPITKVVVTIAPGASATPVPALAEAAFIYDVPQLRLMLAVPGSLTDLTSAPIRLAGDQAVNAVAFGSARLTAAGCPVSAAPLGIITFDTDKGGVPVADIAGRKVYYLDPPSPCQADASLLPLLAFKAATKSIVTDTEPPN